MNAIARYLYEIGQLKRVRRSGWWLAGIDDPESVAEHSFRTAVLGFILADLTGADSLKTALMCLFHDAHESRLNDLHRPGQRYAREWQAAEAEAAADQIVGLSTEVQARLAGMFSELANGETLEAQLSQDADLLECLIQAREYQSEGYPDVQAWIDNCRSGLKTDAARQLAEACLNVAPGEWWRGLNLSED